MAEAVESQDPYAFVECISGVFYICWVYWTTFRIEALPPSPHVRPYTFEADVFALLPLTLINPETQTLNPRHKNTFSPRALKQGLKNRPSPKIYPNPKKCQFLNLKPCALEADYVVVAVPLVPATRGLIGPKEPERTSERKVLVRVLGFGCLGLGWSLGVGFGVPMLLFSTYSHVLAFCFC